MWETYDRVVGLDLADITVDGQITKAPCGGEVAGTSSIDREDSGMTATIVIRRLIRESRTSRRSDTRPARRP